MRFAALAMTAAALTLATAGGACAAEYATFQSYCIAHHGDRAAALAAADAAGGWTVIDPKQIPAPSSPNFKLDDYAMRMKRNGQGFEILMVGSGTTSPTPAQAAVPAKMCLLVGSPADPADAPAVKAWAGMAPAISIAASSTDLYLFRETPAGHVAVDATAKEMPSGPMTMLITALPDGKAVMLGYVAMNPAR